MDGFRAGPCRRVLGGSGRSLVEALLYADLGLGDLGANHVRGRLEEPGPWEFILCAHLELLSSICTW